MATQEPKLIHVQKKITFLKKLTVYYKKRIENSLGDCKELEENVKMLEELINDLIDVKHHGMPARFKIEQAELFNNYILE